MMQTHNGGMMQTPGKNGNFLDNIGSMEINVGAAAHNQPRKYHELVN